MNTTGEFPPDLLLIDGRHMLWRAADKFDELNTTTPEGVVYTGAVYGFLTILCKAHATFGGSVVICWDDWIDGPKHRKAMCPEYKLRKKAISLEENGEQKQVLVSSMMRQQYMLMPMLTKFGIPQAYSAGWEADDVMGTLANRLGKGRKVGIFTGDRDLYQCVTQEHRVIRPIKGGEYLVAGPNVVKDEYGVKPEQMVELKALAGDNGDCIPGIKGIGLVLAAKVLVYFDTAFDACDWAAAPTTSLEGITPRIEKLLAEGKASAKLSKDLATININAPLTFIEGEKDAHGVTQELVRLKFKSILTGGRRERLLEMGLPLGG